MEQLLAECFIEIFQYLDPKEICMLSETSKYMNGTVKNNTRTHLYQLPDKIIEKIFEYVECSKCLKGFENSILKKKINKKNRFSCNKHTTFVINYNFLKIASGMGGFAFSS